MTKIFNANRASCLNAQDSETKNAWDKPEPLQSFWPQEQIEMITRAGGHRHTSSGKGKVDR